MMRFWLLALRNLGRNRKRNLATGSAIAFGFAGVFLLTAYSYRASNYIRVYTVFTVHTGHIAIFSEGGFENNAYQPAKYSLSSDDQKLIEGVLRDDPDVELFEKQIKGQGLIGNGCVSFPFVGQGYEPKVDQQLRQHPQVKEWMPDFKHLLEGENLWSYPAEMGALQLSNGLSLALGKTKMHRDFATAAPIAVPDCANPREQAKRDANVQLIAGAWAGNISATDGEVVGLYTTGAAETDNSGLVTDVSLLQKLYDTDKVTQYSVWLKDPEKLKIVQGRLLEKFREKGKTFQLVPWNDEDLSPFYVGTVKFLKTLVIAGGLVLATIITLSVLNSVTLTILERAQEIGMYRSMGFRKSQLRLLYVQESVWLSGISIAAGALGAYITMYFINAAKIIYHPPGNAGGLALKLVIPPHWAFFFALILLALVCAATYFAVSNRLRPSPADLLGGTLR